MLETTVYEVYLGHAFFMGKDARVRVMSKNKKTKSLTIKDSRTSILSSGGLAKLPLLKANFGTHNHETLEMVR